ncbi:zinc finger protein 1035 [Corythoichthys intestinalis]|uniref:zinc finger protein 1035 n=1 Tax=Corythoichthys intestinalis TaxID=161448 RepID=UPI0025A58653|nr:zinc finger protein 1035 [Corythoichthys intestinalis]XP_057689674.1 zinc finger protein 1035 [Corythoichthys intestinalis]XP_057689675.1 zinc finger protein 1035 [Corythoichthys intestinalis]XP_057689676.1 zinc finger protein 1035 [Corythoichthys intestinalis]
MAHEWDSYLQNITPLSSEPKALRTSEPGGSLAQHIETFVGQHEFSNSAGSHGGHATDSTFDTNFYSTSSVGNTTSDCTYESFYRESSWKANEELLKDTPLRCEATDVGDVATNGLSSSGPLPSSYSMELQGLKQNCEFLASSLLEDYSDVSSCSDTDVNETRPPCKFMTTPTQHSKIDSSTKQIPSEWLFSNPENVTFSNEMNAISPGSLPLIDDGNLAECLQEANTGSEKNGSFNTEHRQSYSDIPKTESGSIEDSNCEGVPVQKEMRNVEHSLMGEYYSDISMSDNENLTGTEDDPDHMKDHETATPVCTKSSFAMMEAENDELERGQEEMNQSRSVEQKVDDNPDANGQQKINMTNLEDTCRAVNQREELGEKTFNVPKQTNIDICSQDESMGTDNLLSKMKLECHENEMEEDNPQISESNCKNANCELAECSDMVETNRQDTGSSSQLLKDQPSQTVVLDNTCSSNPMSDGHLADTSDTKSLCLDSDFSENSKTPTTDSNLVSEDLESQKSDNENASNWPQRPCSSADTKICDKEEIMDFQEGKQTSSQDADCRSLTIDTSILDVHAENKHSISKQTNFSHECCSNKDKDSIGNSSPCPEKSHSEQEQTQCSDENVKLFSEVMDTSETEKSMLIDQSGEPNTEIQSADSEEDKCIVQSNSNINNQSEEQCCAVKSSIQMRKRLQPVVIIKKMEPALSNLYQCAVCQQVTPSADQLIEHYHCEHSDQMFQFFEASNQYLISNGLSDKHVSNKPHEPQLASTHQKRKPHHCSICNVNISKIFEYVKHMRSHTGKTPYQCDQCNVYFAQSGCLKRHKAIAGRCRAKGQEKPDVSSHHESTPSTPEKAAVDRTLLENLPQCSVNLFDICTTNICVYCGNQYATPRRVKKHIYNIHKGQPPGIWQDKITMRLAKRRKATASNILVVKTKNIENETRHKYKCPLCPRLFMYYYNRARHLRDCVRLACSNMKKFGDRYRCPLCRALFTQSANRYRHIKDTCLKRTIKQLSKERVKSDEMVRLNTKKEGHKKVALQNKQKESELAVRKSQQSYNCDVCPAVFQQVSGLYKHVKEHESKITAKLINYKTPVLSSKSKITSLMMKKTDETQQKALSCRFCDKHYDTELSLKMHERCHKGERPYRCLDCGRGFKKRVNLMSHKVVHQSLPCTICKKILPNARSLVQHIKLHHKGKKVPCPNCEKKFLNAIELLSHMKLHKREGKAPVLNERTLKTSSQERSKPATVTCSLCKEVFDNTHLLRKHSLAHISSSQCPYCDQTFKARRYLLSHMFKHTGGRPYSCAKCGKRFRLKASRKIHEERCMPVQIQEERCIPAQIQEERCIPAQIQVCSDPEKYQCSLCSRMFAQKSHLAVHNKGHRLNTLRLCVKCGMYFGLSKLYIHKRKCGGRSKHRSTSSSNGEACQTIQAKSQTKSPSHSSLSRLLPFKCPNCPRRFRYISMMLKHSVSHTGIQPYPCKHCGERFSSNSMKLLHEERCHDVSKEEESNESSTALTDMPTYMEEAQISLEKSNDEYKCKFCTKTFVKARSLRRHILTHNEVNPYRCKICGSCFSRYDYLKVHQGHCKGKRKQLKICIPKISLDDVGKGWKNKLDGQPMKLQGRVECKVCFRSFPNQSSLSRHFTLLHGVKSFKCPNCDAAFTHERTLTYHLKIRKCRKTSQKSNSSTSQNVSETHNEEEVRPEIQHSSNIRRKYSCSYCFRVFAQSSKLQYHIRLHTGEKPFVCDCGLRFIRKDYLHRHKRKCHVRLCKACNVAFPQHELKDHQKACPLMLPQSTKREESPQSPTKGFSCAYCSLRFSLFSQLQEHFLNAHKMETIDPPVSTAPLQHHLSKLPTVKIDRLDKQPSEGSNLTCKLDTELVGDVSESFICPVCDLSFENKAGLKGHSRVHSKETPYKCKTCEKGFWNKNLFRNHNRKCRNGYYKAKNTAKIPVNTHLNLTLPNSVLVFRDESEMDTGVLQKTFSCKEDLKTSPQNPVNDQMPSSINKEKVTQYQCSECDLSFTDGLMLISHLEEHGREEQAIQRSTCTKCRRVFASYAEMEKHMKSHGLSKKFSCSVCPKAFYEASELETHKSYHDSNRPFACDLCGHRFWSRRSLGNHYSKDHPETAYSCRFCEKTYASKNSLKRHCKASHPKELKNSESQLELEQKSIVASESDHDESSSSDDSDSAPYFPCHVCGKTFPTSENLEDHQKCHLGVKPHECAECGKCFFQAAQLEQHKRMHMSELQCQVCGRGFVSLFALRKHKHTHGKSRPYRCSKCQLSFSGASQLAEHMSNHREDNFPCDICSQVFPSKISRAEHRKEHTMSVEHHSPLPEKSSLLSESSTKTNLLYKCGLCIESFKDATDFSEHGCQASSDRPYSCPDCDRHFLHSSHLQKHSVSHHKLKTEIDYSCNCCDTTCPTLELFINHLKTHENELPGPINHAEGYKCPICGCSFVKATELISHFSVHSRNTLNCKVCKKTFSTKNELEEHEQSHHSSVSKLEHGTFHQHASSDQSESQRTLVNAGKETAETKQKDAGEDEEVDVTGEDLHNCNICSTRFPSKSVLLEHQNKVHLNQIFKCKYCTKSFAYKHTLQKHEEMMHTKKAQPTPPQTNLQCPQCFCNFSKLLDLSTHMRMHAEQQVGKYRCEMCYKSFASSDQLQRHQESHVGQIVYECTECDKAFAFPHLLEVHQKTHV